MSFRDERGQAVTEMALLLPFLLVLVLGVIEFTTAMHEAVTASGATPLSRLAGVSGDSEPDLASEPWPLRLSPRTQGYVVTQPKQTAVQQLSL